MAGGRRYLSEWLRVEIQRQLVPFREWREFDLPTPQLKPDRLTFSKEIGTDHFETAAARLARDQGPTDSMK